MCADTVRACCLSSVSAGLILCVLLSVVVDGESFQCQHLCRKLFSRFAQVVGCLSWTWLSTSMVSRSLFQVGISCFCPWCLKHVRDRLLVLDMFIQHVYGVTIPCFHRLHILGVTSEVQSTIQKLMPPALNTRAFVTGTDEKHRAVSDIGHVQCKQSAPLVCRRRRRHRHHHHYLHR